MALKYFFLTSLFSLISIFSYAQTTWKSDNYGYSIEIPQGFTETTPIGQNVNFKAENGNSSIVVVVKILPAEYANYSIWELLGDLSTFGDEWEYGAREYMKNPKFKQFGKTKIDGQDTFWYDYTTDSPKLHSKVYQTQKGKYLFTFTLTSLSNNYNSISPVWFRFKENINL